MRTLEAIAISKTIVDGLEESKSQLVEEFTKNGFVSVDGTVKQYNPRTYDFVDLTADYLTVYINNCIKNKWSAITDNEIIADLEANLPQVTGIEVQHFSEYLKQYETEINTDLTETKLTELLNQYEQWDDVKISIADGHDVASQIIVMKQNRIFVNLKSKYFFKYKDGQFLRFTINDIIGLLNDYIASEDVPIKLSDVQRNQKTYLTSLTNVQDVFMEYQKQQDREHTLQAYEDDYKKILKLIKNY